MEEFFEKARKIAQSKMCPYMRSWCCAENCVAWTEVQNRCGCCKVSALFFENDKVETNKA